jgi:hypothetical protein
VTNQSSPIRNAWPLLLVFFTSGLAWALLLVAVPAQDFPLADDWVSSRSAILFASGKGINYLHGRSVPQLGHWLWAAPFIWLSGGSHTALRISTVLISWLGLWGLYDLLRQEGFSQRQAALATAVLAFNPLFFLVQGTFMTDVPALSLCLVALALYGRAFGTARPGLLLAAMVVTTLAVATRQNALCVPVTAAFVLWRYPGLRFRPLWQAGVLVPLIAGVVTELWFVSRPDVVPFRATLQPPLVLILLMLLAVHALGLAMVPLLVQDPWPWLGRFRLRTALPEQAVSLLFQLILAGAFGAALVGCLYYWPSNQTFFGNIIHPFDPDRILFPYSIALISPWGPFGGPFMVGEGPLYMGHGLRIVLTVSGCAAGGAFLWRCGVRLSEDGVVCPLIIFALFQLGLLAICQQMNDRYFLFLMPAALYVCGSRRPAGWLGTTAALLTLLASAVIAVGLMHDWLSWNSARWQLGEQARTERGIDPWDIEGGFEWDGWFAPETQEDSLADHPGIGAYKQIHLPANVNFRFMHVTGRYAISFIEPPQTHTLGSQSFKLWLLPGQRRLYLVEYPPP